MTPERWQQVKSVFDQAVELAPDQRSSFLDRACSTDHSLRREVESLLSSDNDARSSFLQSSTNAGLRLSKGARLGDFEILSLLGAGGMGEVYRARDHQLERDVAIKVLPRFLSFDRVRLHRFEWEAKAAAALNHPNILAVFHLGTYEDAPYFVSELLEGETLRARLKLGPLPKATDYAMQIACGLEAAHERGIVHRDLKPENLFITNDGRVKILDFGLAKLSHQVASQSLETEPGAVLGTVGYMSPEQVRGLGADHRADIFSFGAILYEMLSGKRAFAGETSADTMSAVLNKQPESISRIARNIPPAIEQVVRRCLEKNADQRFQSTRALITALRLSSESRPSPFAFPSTKTIRRAALSAGIILALSSLLAALKLTGLPARVLHHASGPHLASATGSGPSAPRYSVPIIYQPLGPDTVAPNGPAFTLTVNGTGFAATSVVCWNGRARTTTFVNQSQLKASIPPSDIAKADTAAVTVVNPGPGGGSSNEVFLSFAAPSSVFNLARTDVSVDFQPDSVAAGDFNHDGKLDLVVGNGGGGFASILLGRGDGTFEPVVHYTTGLGPVSHLAVGDFNGDGELDFAVANYGSNNVTVLLGQGDGTFLKPSSFDLGKNPTGIAAGDMNGDGKLDLVVANQNCPYGRSPCGTGTVSVLLGNGDGTFQAHKDFPVGHPISDVTIGDFNGDGKLDLAVVGRDPADVQSASVSILLGKGDGTFRAPVRYRLNTNPCSVATADFNADGKLDLVVLDNVGVASILLGNGDGTFQPRVDYPVGSFPYGSIGIGDLTGRGRLDLAVASGGSSSVTILFGNGDGTFQPQGLRFATATLPQGVAVGDFKRNGRLDLAVAARSGSVVSLLSQ